ncbi:MAG: leucine--tRNA ligase, partial [Gammaproteobacteria bacterium]|nr:leucine--tRNA ligase [Gammaproteobacteria bacterium]
WIGRSLGTEIDFELARGGEPLRVFTTRPDTLLGATYMAVAPGHPLAQARAGDDPSVAEFIAECQRMGTTEATLETMEKRGIALGEDAIHPVTGERLAVWVANFVLMTYGTGAIMAVPGHDERDHAFATKYALPIRQVIAPADGSHIDIQEAAFVEHGVVVNSGEFDGLDFAQAFDAIADWLEQRGKGKRTVNYRLRDWGVSRQRYWGCPVPIVHCDACGEVPVPDDDLPVVLPEDVEVGGGGSPLEKLASFVETRCPQCDGPAKRDTDTFDTFVESSWYFARFCCVDQDEAMLDERADYWMPVDQYIGGIEHAILHLLYARFFQKLMRDEGLARAGEPFRNLLTQGMVLAETFYRRNDEGQIVYYAPNEVEVRQDDKGKIVEAKLAADGRPVELGGVQSMSKSKRNGVDPEALTDRYGADTVRLYMMFTSPPDQTLEWSDAAVEGMFRFLRRVWKLVFEHVEAGPAPALDKDSLTSTERELRRLVHETIAKVSDDIGRRYKFNTAIGAVMELINALSAFEARSANARAVVHEGLEAVVLMLSPIVPHITHALWQALGHEEAVMDASWPEHDAQALARDTIDLVVQVNGKKRGEISVGVDAGRDAIEQEALRNANVARFVNEGVKKIIVVPGKLVNIVV